MATSVLARGRQSSIEFEPPTLTLEQLKYAREAALFVLRTTTQEQAVSIFTEGLKPVPATINRFELEMEEEDDMEYEDEFRDVERDVMTAPF